jgi:acetolactate synthase-1/2/3 large subunit
LSEIVATGCADGYARMTGRPAATLLHCGPGFANGIANLHNARRAHSPVVNIVGDHASWHRPNDPPLASDLEGLARAASHWVRRIETPGDVGRDTAAAVEAARAAPGHIATLIAPADMAWSSGTPAGALSPARDPAPVGEERLLEIAAVLKSGEPVLLLLAREGLLPAGLAAAERLRQACGAALMAPMHAARGPAALCDRSCAGRAGALSPHRVVRREGTDGILCVSGQARPACTSAVPYAYPGGTERGHGGCA